jgi:conjugal transfer pilus assembly protein TraE
MKIEFQESALMQIHKRKILAISISYFLGVLVMLQAISMILLIKYAHNKHESHFIPPHITQNFSLSKVAVSDTYLRDMSHFLIQLRFNITPNTANTQFNAFLNYIAPVLYGDIRSQLVKEMEQIKHEHLSIAFYPLSFDIDVKKFTVKVLGDMKRFVGSELMSETRETYLMEYTYENGLLKIKNIEKVKG